MTDCNQETTNVRKWLASILAFTIVAALVVPVAAIAYFAWNAPRVPDSAIVLTLNADGTMPESIIVEWDQHNRRWKHVQTSPASKKAIQVKVFTAEDTTGSSYGLVGAYSMFHFSVSRDSVNDGFSIPFWKTRFNSDGNVVDSKSAMPGLLRVSVTRQEATATVLIPSLDELEAADWQSGSTVDGRRQRDRHRFINSIVHRILSCFSFNL